jgi:hypothetical protein
MNPFIADYKTRLKQWKMLREQIQQESDLDAKIDLCLQFWQQAPEENMRINWDDASEWPGAWDLLSDNTYCTSSHSLGIAYTLMLADSHTFPNVKLELIWDTRHSVQRIVAKTHGYYLNWGHVDKTAQHLLQHMIIQDAWEWHNKQWISTRPK